MADGQIWVKWDEKKIIHLEQKTDFERDIHKDTTLQNIILLMTIFVCIPDRMLGWEKVLQVTFLDWYTSAVELVDVKMIELANQIKQGGPYCWQKLSVVSSATLQF